VIGAARSPRIVAVDYVAGIGRKLFEAVCEAARKRDPAPDGRMTLIYRDELAFGVGARSAPIGTLRPSIFSSEESVTQGNYGVGSPSCADLQIVYSLAC
jgi:hypothetical protein